MQAIQIEDRFDQVKDAITHAGRSGGKVLFAPKT
jgi:hypothetical protein